MEGGGQAIINLLIVNLYNKATSLVLPNAFLQLVWCTVQPVLVSIVACNCMCRK